MRKYLMILIGLLGAVLLSQLPAFHQQYLQRVGGTLDEIDRQVAALDARAAEQDLDRFGYIRRFLNSSDGTVRGEGRYLESLLTRQIRIRKSLEVLRTSPTAMQLPLLIQYLDYDTAEGVAADFAPSLTLTVSGLSYAAAGFGAGFLGAGILLVLVPRRRRRPAPETTKGRKEPRLHDRGEEEHPYRMP